MLAVFAGAERRSGGTKENTGPAGSIGNLTKPDSGGRVTSTLHPNIQMVRLRTQSCQRGERDPSVGENVIPYPSHKVVALASDFRQSEPTCTDMIKEPDSTGAYQAWASALYQPRWRFVSRFSSHERVRVGSLPYTSGCMVLSEGLPAPPPRSMTRGPY